MERKGIFVISLDFELYWGLFDKIPLKDYEDQIKGVRDLIPILLNRFTKHDIHVTWAIVGFLFFSNKKELVEYTPEYLPNYIESHLSPYKHFQNVGENENEDPYHFGAKLIHQIKSYQKNYQEIATHTFSHYYCLAAGHDKKSFEADIKQKYKIASQHDLKIESIVFPRNQVNTSYLSICKKYGIEAFRGNEIHWLYDTTSEKEGLVKRTIRLLDSYINISGHHIYSLKDLEEVNGLVNIPSSRFLRPYYKRLRHIESLKLKRIKASMTKAAKEGKIYHIWWHPHNFGVNIKENLQVLDAIIKHRKLLQEKYGMISRNMHEVKEMVLENSRKYSKEVVK